MKETETGRHATLYKKAKELSTLCDAEVAVIAFTKDGKLHEYCTGNVDQTVERYNQRTGRAGTMSMQPDDHHHHHQQERIGYGGGRTVSDLKGNDDQFVRELEEENAALTLDKMRRTGKNLGGLSKEELYALEDQQKDAMISLLKEKEMKLAVTVQRARAKERQAVQELENVKRGLKKRKEMMSQPECSSSVSPSLRASSNVVSVSNRAMQDAETGLLSPLRLGYKF